MLLFLPCVVVSLLVILMELCLTCDELACAVLLWLLVAASIKTARPQIAKQAIELVEQRLSKEGWPESYDGQTGRYVGKQRRTIPGAFWAIRLLKCWWIILPIFR